MAEKPSNGGGTVGQLVAEMREAIIELAGNRALFDTRDLWLERAARAAGISKRMAKSFFYNEPCNPSAEVVESVRRARDIRAKDKGNLNVASSARTEYQQLVLRIENIEALLRLQDQKPDRIAADARRKMDRRNNRAMGGK